MFFVVSGIRGVLCNHTHFQEESGKTPRQSKQRYPENERGLQGNDGEKSRIELDLLFRYGSIRDREHERAQK